MLRAILLYLSILPILLVTPSHAVSKKELVAKDLQLEERLLELESRFLTGDPAAEQLIKRNYALEATVRSLRGEVEQLMYELGQSNKKIDALYGDIDINLQRIIRLEHQLEELNSAFENLENSFVSSNVPSGTIPNDVLFENTNNDDYIVNFDTATKWLKMRKDSLKRTLIESYRKNIDYKINLQVEHTYLHLFQ